MRKGRGGKRKKERESGEGRERWGGGESEGVGGREALLWAHNYLKSHFYFRCAVKIMPRHIWWGKGSAD